jgi:hypothetical protein
MYSLRFKSELGTRAMATSMPQSGFLLFSDAKVYAY